MKLIFPTKILDQHLVVLGKTGAGKSSALRHVVEHLLTAGDRVCIIDPKGDWYGLKSSADGKGAGFPVVLFGDFKNPDARDVPINEASGKPIAELVVAGNRPCVIGFRGWTQGAMHRFWIDFASAVFGTNGGKLYLVVDEVHNFAPKGKVISPEVGQCLHWMNRLMNEGRGIGLVNLIASQRPQKVHNDTLTACETIVAMRVVHAADRGSIEEWIEGCGNRDQGRFVLNSLASLARGEAWVWSPECGFGPQRLTFPMFTTYDSFAPPQLLKRITKKGWADVDLSEVTAKLSAAIAESKANDPKELKQEVARLKRALADAEKQGARQPAKVDMERVPVKAISRAVEQRDREWRVRFTDLQNQNKSLVRKLETNRATLGKVIESMIPADIGDVAMPSAALTPVNSTPRPQPVVAARQTAPPHTTVVQSDERSDGNLAKGELAILSAVLQYGEVDKAQLSVLCGYKKSSRDTYLKQLRQQGLITTDGGIVRPTEDAQARYGDVVELLPTGEELRLHWCNTLPAGEAAILNEVMGAYPDHVDRDHLSEVTGYKKSSRDTYLKYLRARQLVTTDSKGVRASDHLFA